MAKKKKVVLKGLSEKEEIIRKINEKYKGGFLLSGNNDIFKSPPRIITGILPVDMVTYGGIPAQKITMMWGKFSSGKSYVAYKTGASAQRLCRECYTELVYTEDGKKCPNCGGEKPMSVMIVDMENSYDREWAARIGMIVDDVLVLRPEYGEQMVDIVDDTIRNQLVDLIIIDSIAATIPTVEIVNSAENQQQGVAARLLNKAFRKWPSSQLAVYSEGGTPATLIVINQIREKIGIIYGSSDTAPGGRGQEFVTHLRLKMFGKSYIFIGDNASEKEPIGRTVGVRVDKSKCSPAMEETEFPIYYRDTDKTISGDNGENVAIVKSALEEGIIYREKASKPYKLEFDDAMEFKTQKVILEKLDTDIEFRSNLRAATLEHYIDRRLNR